jgi:hypothetical protein
MTNQYRVVPVEKQSITYFLSMYRNNKNGSESRFRTCEHWEWAQGFLDEDKDMIPYEDDSQISFNIDTGWGCEFEGLSGYDIEFSDDLSEAERNEIEECYREGGTAWALNGNHAWMLEFHYFIMCGPYKIDLVDFSTQTVIEENIKFPSRQESVEPFHFPTR